MPKHIRSLLFFALCGLALAQTPVQITNPCLALSCYFATQSGTVASSGTSTLTIQQPANGFRQVTFIGAVIKCPGQSFNVDQAQNGTAATATAGSAVALVPFYGAGTSAPTASAIVYTASNVGAGTSVAPTLLYSSGAIASIDLSTRTMNVAGGAVNYSVKLTNTGSGSCTGTVAIYWAERQ